jgi:hypothetical protein
VDPHDTESTHQPDFSGRRTELDIGARRYVSDDAAVASAPTPSRGMADRNAIARLEHFELVGIAGVDRQLHDAGVAGEHFYGADGHSHIEGRPFADLPSLVATHLCLSTGRSCG